MRGFRVLWAAIVTASLILAAGVWLVREGHRTELPPQPTAAQMFSTSPKATDQPAATPATPAMSASPPTRIRIRTIDVEAPVTPIGLDAKGQLQPPPPDNNNLVGWYQAGAAPGQDGTAVMAGHVDNKRGLSVFYALGRLHPGAEVDIDRKDHTTAVFTVDAVEVYPKDHYPSDKVYGRTGRPELRLITCGGDFTKETGYQGNVVAYAHLARTET
ncbi:sortase family protein [Streptomyces sp. TLI_235]|nr:class F sortase [Streptomyces sp. TLI_235]PBC70058.1 sortase family protein [Streptomyces sp. TLI_235]